MGPLIEIRNTPPPPPILNKNVPTWIFQTPLELFEKTKRGSKNYRYIFRQHKIRGHNTQWGKVLNDNTISNIEVNKKLHWLSNSELSQDIVDRQQCLLYITSGKSLNLHGLPNYVKVSQIKHMEIK